MDALFRTSFVTLGTAFCLMGQQEQESKSLAYYESILEKHPEMAEARFGAGWAAYKLDDFSRALSEFESALGSDDADLRVKAFYNLGNSLHREGRLEESLQAYRRALELNPNDEDAKYNYELTRYLLEHKQKTENDSEDGEKKPEEYDQEENSQSGPSEQGTQKGEDENETEGELNRDKREAENEKPNAESILNALRSNEKNLLKRRLDTDRSVQREKDW